MRSKKLIEEIAEKLRRYGYHVNEYSYMGNTFDRKDKIRFYGVNIEGKNVEKYTKEVGSYNGHKLKVIEEFFQ